MDAKEYLQNLLESNDLIEESISSAIKEKILSLLSHSNWKDIVREAFKRRGVVGEAKANPLYMLVWAIAMAFNIASADEFINKIDNIKSSFTQSEVKKDSALVDKIEQLIPYPVTDEEMSNLQYKNIPKMLFNFALSSKIKKALKDEILPEVQKDPEFKKMSADELSRVVFDAFKKKLERKEYKDSADVMKQYLQAHDSSMSDFYNVVQTAINKSIH